MCKIVYSCLELITNLEQEIRTLKLNGKDETVSPDHHLLDAMKSSLILITEDWSKFKEMFNKVYPVYLQELKTLGIEFTPAEMRFLMLEKLGITNKEKCKMLGVVAEAICHLKFRIKKRLTHCL